MKDLRVDREQAIKVAAMVGLLILAISILPGLLRAPEPPDLPSDVGFRPSEATSGTVLPGRGKPVREAEKKDPVVTGNGREAARGNEARDRRERRRRNARKRSQQTPDTGPEATNTPVSAPAAPVSSPPPAPPAPAPATPPQIISPPPAPPRPQPSPDPPPRGDGSEEFAPR